MNYINITENKAEVAAGLSYLGIKPILKDIIYKNNNASLQGSDIFSYPSYFKLVNDILIK